MADADHEFGSVSTDLKINMVGDYLRAFTTALRTHFSSLLYIDAFAGTGERTVRRAAEPGGIWNDATPERIERLKGSARIALDTDPTFTELHFIDSNPKHCAALEALVAADGAANSSRIAKVWLGDANDELKRILEAKSWSGCRGVLFLDPYGMNVPWSTLENVRATEALDVWYLVSLAGLYRQAPRNARDLTGDKRAAITRMLGTDEWEREWYSRRPEANLFDDLDETYSRTADVKMIEAYTTKRLRALFPAVLEPLTLRNDRGLPMSSLYFMVSNPNPKAIAPARRIADHILKAGRSSQTRPR